jgi:ABC-type nickel/cobalt efflux system permease component RcnA
MLPAIPIALSGLLLVIANIVVTFGVARSTSFERAQKIFQYALIWLVPIAGAAMSWYVLREEQRASRRSSDGGNEYLSYNYPDDNEGHSGDGSHKGHTH